MSNRLTLGCFLGVYVACCVGLSSSQEMVHSAGDSVASFVVEPERFSGKDGAWCARSSVSRELSLSRILQFSGQTLVVVWDSRWGLAGMEPRGVELAQLWFRDRGEPWDCNGVRAWPSALIGFYEAGGCTYAAVEAGAEKPDPNHRGTIAVFRLSRTQEPQFVKMYHAQTAGLLSRGGGAFHGFSGATVVGSDCLLLTATRTDYRMRSWSLIPTDGLPAYRTLFLVAAPPEVVRVQTFHKHAWGDMRSLSILPAADGNVWAAWCTDGSGRGSRTKAAGLWYANSPDGLSWSDPQRFLPGGSKGEVTAPFVAAALVPDGEATSCVYMDARRSIGVCRDIRGHRNAYRLNGYEVGEPSQMRLGNVPPIMMADYNDMGEVVVGRITSQGARFTRGLDESTQRYVDLDLPVCEGKDGTLVVTSYGVSSSLLDRGGKLHLLWRTELFSPIKNAKDALNAKNRYVFSYQCVSFNESRTAKPTENADVSQ